LLDENFRNIAATISLYIRISYLSKCLITEITQVKKVAVDTVAIKRKKIAADILIKRRNASPIIATDNEIINDEQDDIQRKNLIHSLIKDAVAITKTKGYAIKDNGERAFKKASSTLSNSKHGRNTATIGITERGKRISPSSSSLQTYPLCCQLQPHLTCFTDCFDVSPCYCYWTSCPFQFFYSV
ncbi:hypothetical protein ALC60_06754, partial [Trachymyrmex zeteki]